MRYIQLWEVLMIYIVARDNRDKNVDIVVICLFNSYEKLFILQNVNLVTPF